MNGENVVREYDYYTLDQARQIIAEEQVHEDKVIAWRVARARAIRQKKEQAWRVYRIRLAIQRLMAVGMIAVGILISIIGGEGDWTPAFLMSFFGLPMLVTKNIVLNFER